MAHEKAIIKSGYMNKQGGSFKTWKKRWFTLEDGEVVYLSYFPNEKAEGALGTLDLSQCRAVRPVPTKDTAKSFFFEVDAPDRTYLINIDSNEGREEWIQAIQSALDRMQLKRDGNEFSEAKTGFLFKQGGKEGNKGWRKRWFVLQNDSLIYYKSENDKKILGRLSLNQCNSIGPADPLQVRREFCFKLGFAGRTYIIGAENSDDRDDWMETLEACVPETAQRGAAATAVTEQDEEGGEEESSAAAQSAPSGVQTDALIVAQQEAEQQPIAKAGFLAKTGGTVKSVKRRWFVLRGNLLSYYQTENDKEALGTIDLNKCTGLKIVEDDRRGVRPNSFELITPKRTYVISADTPEERSEWKTIIEDTIPEEPQVDDEEAANFAARALSETAKSVKRAVDVSRARLFGGDGSAPVESDPNAMKMIANSADDDDNAPASPNQPKSMLDVGALKAGWMNKQGGSVKSMKRRYFVLRGLALAYYKSDQDTGPQGVIDLTQCTGVDKKPAPPKGQNNWGFDIITRARTFYVEAESETSRQQWIAVIGSQVDAKNRPDQAALIASKREGYLEKRGGANRAWKRRYFVVLGTRLFYFSDEKRERPLGAIELKECFGVYSVPLARHGRPNVFELVTPDRIYAIVGDSEEIRDGWMSLIADMIPASDIVSSLSDGEATTLKEGQVKAGILEKKPADNKLPWAKRWVALGGDNILYIHRTDKDTTPIQVIDLKTCTAVREVPRGSTDRPFALSIQGRGNLVYYLAASSQPALAEWVTAIREVIPDEETRAAETEVEPVLMCGYVNKMGGSRKSWRKRWFVFRGHTIRYYKGPKDDEELGSIDLDLLADSTCVKGDLKLDVPNGFALITPDRTYYCGAETEDIRTMWLTSIRKYLDARGPVDPNKAAKQDGDDDD